MSTDNQALGVAALFVDPRGVYSRIEAVDCWGEDRDARRYPGDLPVVAHPPCQRWGALATGGPKQAGKFSLGDDGGCFGSALRSVRCWGGVLEHPAYSRAWSVFGLARPPKAGGWVAAGDGAGYTCHLEQGHYGHRARKATWLYTVSSALPTLLWGSSLKAPAPPMPAWASKPPGGLSPEQRAERRKLLALHEQVTGKTWVCAETMNRRERAATPEPFARLLVSIARESAR